MRPYKEPGENRIEIINEINVSIVLLFYIMATDIVEDENIRYYAGYGIVVNLLVNIVINLSFFFYNAYFIMKLKVMRERNRCNKKMK
jgi:hypothetical protein